MSDLKTLINTKPWAREYLYFDPDLKEDDVVFDENLNKFKLFLGAMEDTRANSQQILSRYSLPDHKEIIELLAVFRVMTATGTATAEEQDIFFGALSTFIQDERAKGQSADDLFEDRDAIALSRLYQVTDEAWAKKYMTWIFFELGVIDRDKGPDLFGANEAAFQTYDFLKNASDGKWRPQMHYST
ncbi:hypothetical protein ADIAL_2140 [Alkalibacterium sp. AK22]|uniref:hypothetical protein n=1 Tax=Alkalibacterium sp. AK22 TaxID=1229520 RepID=UPI000452ADB1|nr:hypothetical protein [Alkalibacterium sp. AK22]EXJ22554.1 hypothetical protein ADIAL_2140 [Alkalibacterium sp. AK22]